MKERKLQFSNTDLHVYIFDCENPTGVVQIVHGVNEHGLRYVEFAHYLNKHGYTVVVHDHISQGKSRRDTEETVYFGKDGVSNLVEGVILVNQMIRTDYDNLPIIAFGHSLGAGILRKMLIDKEIPFDKVILNGTGLSYAKGMRLIIGIGKIIKLFKPRKPSKFFDNIFRQTQYRLREKVEMDHFIEWLTRDKSYTEINKKDAFLYIRLSVAAFVDMLTMFEYNNRLNKIENMEKNLPILLLSGTHDPATNFGEDVTNLFDVLQHIGVDVDYRLYPEGRHDTIQEINREQVFEDILEFIVKQKK